jgi:hypothetical protein
LKISLILKCANRLKINLKKNEAAETIVFIECDYPVPHQQNRSAINYR